MQENDMAEKKKFFLDGEELEGLVKIDEYKMEKGIIEVPEFHRIRNIQNGIKKIPIITGVFKIQRNNRVLLTFWDWFNKDEAHDVEIVRTDATGTEFNREVFPDCESLDYGAPAFDAANPTYAQLAFRLACWDYIPMVQ